MGMKIDSVFAVSPVAFLEIESKIFGTQRSVPVGLRLQPMIEGPQYRLVPALKPGSPCHLFDLTGKIVRSRSYAHHHCHRCLSAETGKETELLELVRSRVPILCKEGLVTDREPIIMRARDGTIIEVSEWKSQEAIEAAHKNPNVLAMWDKFFAICDCVPFKTLAEAEEMFPNFEPL